MHLKRLKDSSGHRGNPRMSSSFLSRNSIRTLFNKMKCLTYFLDKRPEQLSVAQFVEENTISK